MALVALTARRTRAEIASFHLSSLLFITLSVYVYRNIWPLLTFTLVPADGWEGALLWVKIGLLSLAGIVVPLITPRQYIPLDPKARISFLPRYSACPPDPLCRTLRLLLIQSRRHPLGP
jgi:hypothetical protein